jgi:hypothetical protein
VVAVENSDEHDGDGDDDTMCGGWSSCCQLNCVATLLLRIAILFMSYGLIVDDLMISNDSLVWLLLKIMMMKMMASATKKFGWMDEKKTE